MSNNKEDVDAQISAFKEKYPDFKPAKAIEVLNLIMTRKNAKEILEGKKKVEYRAYTDHYIGRLFDKDVLEFLKKHGEEEDVIKAQEDGIVDPLRVVKTIHFHDYNNSWYLDCDVLVNDTCIVMKEDIDFLHEKYDSHDLDEMYEALELKKEKERPLFFFFVVDKVKETTLK